MDKIERETQDFMNVESFSQLPFIRPAPVNKEKGGIRLFGIEFSGGDANHPIDDSESIDTNACEDTKDNSNNNITTSKNNNNNENNGESSRRFECHYCCRNFPTSQALGGHQNAHKRERQHAKREHLQSAMVHGALSDAHVYGLMNYRLNASSPSSSSLHHHPTYPSWNGNSTSATATTARFYGNPAGSYPYHTQSQPINGSPLAMWRIPAASAAVRSTNPSFGHSADRSLSNPLPQLFAGEEMRSSPAVSGSYMYDSTSKASVQDHVSLDLHL